MGQSLNRSEGSSRQRPQSPKRVTRVNSPEIGVLHAMLPDHPQLARPQDRLRPPLRFQLAEQFRDVSLHRVG